MFSHCPLHSLSPRESGPRRPVLFKYETPCPQRVHQTVQAITADWVVIAKLYELVLAFSFAYNGTLPPRPFFGGECPLKTLSPNPFVKESPVASHRHR